MSFWSKANFLLRLLIIISLIEAGIMVLFGYEGWTESLPTFSRAILDPLLLTLLSAYPIYTWVARPLISHTRMSLEQIEMLTAAIQEAGEGVLITDENKEILYVNRAFTKVTGYTLAEVEGKNPSLLKSGRQDAHFYREMWDQIDEQGVWQGELWNRKKDGTEYREVLNIKRLLDSKGKPLYYVAVFADVTDQRIMEQALAQSQKLESLGTLVSGIAHNFNNLLAAILGKAYLIRSKVTDPKAAQHLRDIEAIGQDAAAMIKQLLIFARGHSSEKSHLPLVALLKETVKTIEYGIPENIHLHTSFGNESVLVFGNSIELQQVVINLLNNARDAVAESERKEIRVSIDVGSCDEIKPLAHCRGNPEKGVRIIVEDTGVGIDEAHLQQLFTPFFTTKGGKGNGLGLAMSYRSIKQHGGSIHAESKPGEGTRFVVCLPVSVGDVDDTHQNDHIVYASENKVVLIVDDDECVRETSIEIIEALGYQTLEAENGKDAMKLVMTQKHHVDVILSDIVMPEMNGTDLAIALRSIKIEVPIIFMTGYDNHAKDARDIEYSRVINKPFDISSLSMALHQALSEKA